MHGAGAQLEFGPGFRVQGRVRNFWLVQLLRSTLSALRRRRNCKQNVVLRRHVDADAR